MFVRKAALIVFVYRVRWVLRMCKAEESPANGAWPEGLSM